MSRWELVFLFYVFAVADRWAMSYHYYAGHYGYNHHDGIHASCQLRDPTGRNPVYGNINLFQEVNSNIVRVWGKIRGLKPGLHGFHVHENGNFGWNCNNARGHFNPFKTNHGAPFDPLSNRHVGDLGNIRANYFGRARVDIHDDQISLVKQPHLSILGRAIVVHADRDDLGRGNNAGSRTTGNAGSRVACCQIVQKHHFKKK